MRILVVEDEKRLAASLKRGLRNAGFAVDVALNGNDGLWMASETDYDAMVLDLMLPGVNGFKICDQLRDSGVWTPILILTAKVGDLDEEEALDTGADDFLRKPFSHGVLVARLRALLRRGRTERPVELSAGDLRLDQVQRRCWRGETVIELTARELAIVEYLLLQQGGVASKQAILAHVWEDDFDGDPSIVEVYVHRIRAKIDYRFDRASIQTVRGEGYRLDRAGG